MSEKIVIATRRSPLAMWQAEFVKAELEKFHNGVEVEFNKMETQGDKILDTPLAKVGGKGLFVKELEVGMLEGSADIAVHSMKDVPVEFPEGLHLAVICEREDPRDAFVSNNYKSLDELPEGAKVGTSSLRRSVQLKAYRPDLQILDLRGNVNTRLRKLDEGQYDAIILAAAGLIRLEMPERIAGYIEPEQSLPAVGQGAVGIECRVDDERILNAIAPLKHQETMTRVLCERAMNNRLEGGCQVPIGGYSIIEGDEIWLRALVGSLDGKTIIRAEGRGPISDPEALGIRIADELLEKGAKEILDEVYNRG